MDDEAIARLWLGEQIRQGLERRRAKGKPLGRRPVSDAVRSKIIELAGQGMGPSAIARQLNEAGIPTPQKAPVWRPSSVAAILKRSRGSSEPGR